MRSLLAILDEGLRVCKCQVVLVCLLVHTFRDVFPHVLEIHHRNHENLLALRHHLEGR